MVEAYTIDGKISLNTEPFDKAIGDITSKMETLMELGGGNWDFTGAVTGLGEVRTEIDTLKSDIESMSNSFSDVKGINALKSEIQSLRTEMDSLKAKINEIGTTAREQATQVGSAVSSTVQKVKNEILTMSTEMSQLRFDRNFMSNATLQGFTQIVQKNRENGQLIRENTGWLKEQEQVHQASLSIYSDIIARLEQEGARRHELLGMIAEEIELLHRVNQINRQGNRDIVSRYEAEGRIYTSIAEQIGIASERNAIEERELMFLDEQLALRTEILALTREGTAEGVKKAETLVKELQGDEKIITAIQEEIAMTKELLSLEESRVGVANATAQAKTKSAVSGTGSANALDKMGNLPRRIGSMALTMWGYNEMMDIANSTMAHINAEKQRDYFAKRMNMDTKALNNFKGELASMQNHYRKLDMTVVGANALETATKYKVQADSLGDLTEVMAIYGSEFVKQGRTQEESILAVNDALDGELRRLKEVGIGKEELEATGLWSGEESDKEGMLKALLQIAEERGYSQTAKDITSLSDAISVLEVRLSIDLAQAFHIIEPILKETAKVFIGLLILAEKLGGAFKDLWSSFGYWLNDTFGVNTSIKVTNNLTKALGYLVAFIIMYKVASKIREMASSFKLLGGAWSKLMEKMGRTKGMEKATETIGDLEKTTTGGTANTPKNGGSIGENFKEGMKGTAKNLGTMAKIFIEVAVAMTLAMGLLIIGINEIALVGSEWERNKPNFDKGLQFIQEFGVWIWGASAILIGLFALVGKIPIYDFELTEGFKTVAIGLAEAMIVVTEAIASLHLPMFAIASLGFMKGVYGTTLDDGMAVIRGVGQTLDTLAKDKSLMIFIGAFFALSLIMGFGGAELLTVPLIIGMATAMGLVAIAIATLHEPLLAIYSLGAMYGVYGEENIQNGAKVITLVGNCLKALEPAIRNLLLVDVEVFGIALVDWANRLLNGGKDGITALAEDIIPKFVDFATRINEMEMPTSIDTGKITALTTIANQIPPLYSALQQVNTALATSDAIGNMGGAIGGSISNAVGMGLSGKLDQIYNDSKAIMDWATKMSSLNGSNGNGGASAVTQVAQAIVDLKAKLTQMSTTVSQSANSIQSSATQLGKALITGWKSGSASFGATVVQTVANGIRAVQNRYPTMANGGKTLGNKLTKGFESHSPKLVTIVGNEILYALRKLDDNEQNFYDRGAKLGKALADGFESRDGMIVGSPARIARAIAQEMVYSKNALDLGAVMMYNSGATLGRALADGYDSNSTLKTNIGMLASKGLTNDELTIGQVKKQANNGNANNGNAMIININMNGANIYGVEDLENTMRNIADRVFIEYNDVNPNIGG